MPGICRWGKDRPPVGLGVELRDVAGIPESHPDVVVLVRDDTVHDGVRLRNGKHRHLFCLPVVFAQRSAHDPSDVDIALGIQRERLRPLDGIPDDVVGIERDDLLELLALGIESKQTLYVRWLHTRVFRQPDHARRIDHHFVDAVLGIRQLVVLLHSRSRVQLDQTMGIAAIGQPYVAVVVEPHVLTRAPADKRGF